MDHPNTYKGAVSVADARKNLADIIGAAHYSDERIMIERRDKPFASVISPQGRQALDDSDDIAQALNLKDGYELMALLKDLIADEERKEDLRKAIVA